MATRTIVTSQPDVACDVCERRLLRGEQPDTFLAAGRRLTVCELCAPRAEHAGWKRESDQPSLALPTPRPRRGRSFLDRLRHGARQPGSAQEAEDARPAGSAAAEEADVPYDIFADPHELIAAGEAELIAQQPADEIASLDPGALALEEALAVFNSSEFPRRVAGVTRSLGAPLVSVAPAEHLPSAIVIVVAWELCWYRYSVDLSLEAPTAEVLAQGTELSELEREERQGNGVAVEGGMLTLGVA